MKEGGGEREALQPHLGQICEKLQLCTRPLQLELADPSVLPMLLPASTSVSTAVPLTSFPFSLPTFYALGSVIPTPSHCLTASYSSYSTESDKNFFDCGQTHARMGKKSERERQRESGKERDG